MSPDADTLAPRWDEPLLGVLGGMGPAATLDFLDKLFSSTPARNDQDHLRLVMWADPRVPDRSQALVHGGPDPTPALEFGITRLVASGAELLVVPCNSAHVFVPRIAAQHGIELIDMVDATVAHVASSDPHAAVGLLTTTGTARAQLYQERFAAAGIETIELQLRDQEELMRVIRLVKAGNIGAATRHLVTQVAERLVRRGATIIAAACTELPLVVGPEQIGVPVVDTTLVLARAAVARIRGVGATDAGGEHR